MGKPAATLGDKHVCPLHGHSPSTIISGSGLLTVNGKPTACIGDKVGCGATIIEGAPVAMAGGQLVAFLGSKTSHGGTIVSGDSALMLDVGMAKVVGRLDSFSEILKDVENWYVFKIGSDYNYEGMECILSFNDGTQRTAKFDKDNTIHFTDVEAESCTKIDVNVNVNNHTESSVAEAFLNIIGGLQ